MTHKATAILALEDGSVFTGRAFGAKKTVVGEAVFNTSMTGYQEVLTDPSYFGQIVTMTAVEIGNYGVNKADEESDGIKVAGFVVREASPIASSWRSEMSLQDYLESNSIPAISGVDTRAITRRIRDAGALKACLSTERISPEEALAKARGWEGLVGVDYVKQVTCKKPYHYDVSEADLKPFTVKGTSLYNSERKYPLLKCAAIDFGAKSSIFRKLSFHGFDVTVFPASVSAEEILDFAPQGLFLSNGPGDPSAVKYAHETVSKLIKKLPTFGICFGHQVITHAIGAKTYKLKFGHRGGNQPVKNLETGKVSITSQNHGFAADKESVENCGGIVTEINLNDNTVEGLRHKDYPLFSVQYHPEAAPGPNDALPLFDDFYKLVEKNS